MSQQCHTVETLKRVNPLSGHADQLRRRTLPNSNEVTLEEYEDEKLREVATDVGLVAMEWNSIHRRLSKIFSKVTGLSYEVAFAIWNSIPNDKYQRDILKGAANEVYKDQEHNKIRKKINRLLDKIDKIQNDRNSSIHAPFALLVEGGDLKVIPDESTNNKRAKALAGEPDVRSTLNQTYRELSDLNRLAWESFANLPRAGIN